MYNWDEIEEQELMKLGTDILEDMLMESAGYRDILVAIDLRSENV